MNFLESLAKQFAGKPIDWDELEETLIRADLGVPMTMRIIKTLQEREAWALLGIGDVIKAVREEIARILPRDPAPIRRATGKPTVILIVGVNGTGKTTSTAKLARNLTSACSATRSCSRPQTHFAQRLSSNSTSGQKDSALKSFAASTAQIPRRFATKHIRQQRSRRLTFCFATQLAGNTRKQI